MAGTKYGKHILQNPFHKTDVEFGGATVFKQNGDDGSPVIFEHIVIDNPEWSMDQVRTKDTHEVLAFIGGDPRNIRDLGAEVGVCLGNDSEEQIINDAKVVTIPPGLKHGPVTIKKFTKPFIMLRIVNTPEYQSRLEAESGGAEDFRLKRLLEGNEVTKYGKSYWMNTISGPLFIDYEPGWTGTSFWAHHNEYYNSTTLGYHCIVTPYDVRMSHAHDNYEALCFLSGDPANPGELGADVKMCIGDEHEEHTFNVPTIVSIPSGLKHCPLLVDNIKKPVVFLEISATKGFAGKPEDL